MNEGRLADYLGAQLGAPVEMGDVRRVADGHSREMYVVDTTGGRFVVRIEQGGVFGTSSADEFQLMQSLHAASFPVAAPRWLEPTGEVLGQPFFVMDFVDADPAPPTLDEAAATAFVRTLAGLHALDPAEHLPSVDADQATHIAIERWRNVGKSAGGDRVPLLDTAELWLHQNVPTSTRVTLVHGDAGPANALMSGGSVVALTDWEFAHVGDPAEDWSSCVSIGGATAMPRTAWLSLIEREARVRMTDAQWTFWEAFNLFKGACANRTCLALFESGQNRSPDMAIMGTAVHRRFLRRLVDAIR